jgi:RecB family exonuclease
VLLLSPPVLAPPTPPATQRQLQLLDRVGTRSTFDGYLDDEKIDSWIAHELQAISPTELENFGECPQKFLLKRLLGVVDYDDPDRELQMPAREKGKLDHTILERFYRSLDRFPPSDFRERLGAVVDQAFDEEEARVPAFNRVIRAIERRSTKRNLYAFLIGDIEDLLANGLRPAHFEYRFGPEPFVITEHDVPIMMKGVVDRIDEGFETLRIVDYKSGKALRHENLSERIDRGMRLQLPLYAMAVAKVFNATNVSGAIKPLMPGSDADKFTFDLADIGPRLRETLDLFIASMLRGRFPAFPEEESCRYCPVNHSCRTKHSDAELRALAQFEDPRGLLELLP